ncbi:L-Lysine epsilon oxidase, N-terminal [Rhabdaerophilaceae bacterium]
MAIKVEDIASLCVYPPIGIARVGNARGRDEYLIAAEVIGGLPTLPDGAPGSIVPSSSDFRNQKGEIKRQAVRFRVYAHMKDGSVCEVTSEDASIEWKVAVANLKAGWYEFNNAMDLPSGVAQPAKQRNSEFVIAVNNRAKLDIAPTPQVISGRNAAPRVLGDGSFLERANIYLGELRTDDKGRLIFLGGNGASVPFRPNTRPMTFANNEGWHDDVSDGPVWAKVTFGGKRGISLEAEPGYVVVAPPNFAPGIFGIVTADDAVRETFYDMGWLTRPSSTFAKDDVLRIFQRLTDLQWVNHGQYILHGIGSPLDADDPEFVKKLNDDSEAGKPWRMSVFQLFSKPGAVQDKNIALLPQAYGDNIDEIPQGKVGPLYELRLTLTPTQYEHLHRWAEGRFNADATSAVREAAQCFDSLSAVEQLHHLKRAALHECLGGPFHPAIELTWVMRLQSIWKEPYRLKLLPGDSPAKQNFGVVLKPEACMAKDGPYDGVAAGALTRWLGVPWQTDHTSCNSGAEYNPSGYLSMPTFWGPRAPDQVLSEGDLMRANALWSSQATQMQAFKHFANRTDWLRDIRGRDYYDRIMNMITEWWELGMVLPPKSLGELPQGTRAEFGRVSTNGPVDVSNDPNFKLVAAVEELSLPKLQPEEVTKTVRTDKRYRLKRTYRQGQI